jgi:tetratricopeptide (TPR) repeat protein
LPNFKYKAFISYSHEDETTARWLHRALETYRPPRGVSSPSSASAHSSAFPLRPIFRDQDELVASANLSNSLVEALQQSEFLIVICSPNSASSRWTSQEIVEFKRIHGPDKVIAVIADGDPDSSFPQPLLQQVLPSGEIGDETLEPLAADLQGGRADRRLALLKVAATMLGTGLDTLVQRDAQRRHRILAIIAMAATVAMVVMGWLTYTAITERRAADAARDVAEQRRQEAEGLIEFMLSDLRGRLEPVGRLDVLDAVGAKALAYYSGQEQTQLSADSLARRARALHLLGEISDMKGDLKAAQQQFTLAAESTQLLLEAEPDDPKRIFDHAQSIYWVGLLAYHQGHYIQAERYFGEYLRYARDLLRLEPGNDDWLLELFYAHQALGGLSVEQGQWEVAETNLRQALAVLERITDGGGEYFEEWPTLYSWLADTYLKLKQFEQAERHSQLQVQAFHDWLEAEPGNYEARRQLVVAQRQAAHLMLIRGDLASALAAVVPLEEELEQLGVHEPDDMLTQEQLTLLHQDWAEMLLLNDQPAQALELSMLCVEEALALVLRDSTNWYWAFNRDRCRYMAAAAAFKQQRPAYAREWLASYEQSLFTDSGEQVADVELSLLAAQTSLLQGDLASQDSRHSEALRHWQVSVDSLRGVPSEMSPSQLVVLIAAQQRLGNLERTAKMIEQLQAVGYRHPAFVALLENRD